MLKRDISTSNILAASAGGMIGSGWLFSPFISAQMAGSNALVSWVIASIFMMFIALPLCELGTMFPVSGGMSNYPTYSHGREVGFLFAWTSWLSYVVMTPIEIQAILQYASHFFPSLIDHHTSALTLSHLGYAVAVLIMIAVVILNSYGIKFLAECNKYASIIKFIIPSIAIIALLSHAPSLSANINIQLSDKQNWIDIFTALSTGGIAFAFTGFQNGLMLGGEIKHPQRNIPIAIIGAVLVGFILYFALQYAFIVAMPKAYFSLGWHTLTYPGDNAPLVGLTILVGLSVVSSLLLFDAAFSPFGTTLVYTAATSRILYGMALNQHLPKLFLKVNRHNIPYVTLYANCLAGLLAFLPFPGWQKLVAFLSSTSILSYGIGPVCLLAMRSIQPHRTRPFKLPCGTFLCHVAFYICNLMLYWCGFSVIWKLDVALLLGLGIYLFCHKQYTFEHWAPFLWFIGYMVCMSVISYLGSFGDGLGILQFPIDLICILPFSVVLLALSQKLVVHRGDESTWAVIESEGT